ncbi:MAG: AMP-binding protein, partial [Thermoleophilia bacterium]|nr:AMP-binding protein [Thermoleophilia bacterium]
MSSDGPTIESLAVEDRRFPPPPELAATAIARPELYGEAAADPEAFWLRQATELLDWITPPTAACDRSRAPFFTWFADGTLNASANCLDRHLAERGDRVAYHWEGEPGDRQTITYRDLHGRVCRLAAGLRELGVRKGDRVAIYLGMVPEIVVAMLACARLGAPHTVVFGGFSPESLRDRILDCGCTALITADGGWRAGKEVPLKRNADAALEECPDVRSVVVVRRTESEVGWTPGRDVWYHELVEGRDADLAPEPVEAEHPLYILYTSGSTGKPKGILHTTGGYLTGVSATHRWVFDA